MFGLFGRGRNERVGFQLYTQAVQAARDPYFYTVVGVPDTLDGRFDLVGLFVVLVIRRVRDIPGRGKSVAQAVFDAMFSDMDINLREMGVSDMAIAKKVRAMWEAFHGRAVAYEAPLAAWDAPGLESALSRNVWRGEASPGAERLAAIMLAQMAALERIDTAKLLAGTVSFAAPGTVASAA